MIKNKIKDFLERITDQPHFDPSSIDDPLASKIDWNPAKRGGASFKTHNLVKTKYDRIEFHASKGAKLFCGVFMLVGLGVLIVFFPFDFSTSKFYFDENKIIPALVGLFFSIVGGGMLYFGTAPIVFDKQSNLFWKGRKSPHKMYRRSYTPKNKNSVELENIHALQLLSEYCSSNKSSYYSYELNLILNNGERINVIDHGSKNKIREDAETLSQFLGKPVWDAI